MNSDDQWTPPTAAELKLIEAKRERADKISNIMGQYLLKGYKMLNSLCPRCTTILLQDKRDQTYCVACMEIDTDTDKDNPATNVEAARSQLAESQLSGSGGDTITAARAVPAETGVLCAGVGADGVSDAGVISSRRTAAECCVSQATGDKSTNSSSVASLIALATEGICDQLQAAVDRLKASQNSAECADLVRLIGACSDTLLSLRRHRL